MDQLRLDSVRKELSPVRKEISTTYQDRLKKLSVRNMLLFKVEFIDGLERGGTFYNYVEEVNETRKEFNRPPHDISKIKSLAEKTYNRLYPESYERVLNLKYNDSQFFSDRINGEEPSQWVEGNIQEIYEETLRGNFFPLVNSMNIIGTYSSSSQSKKSKFTNKIKNLFSLITPDNERWNKLDKSDIDTQVFFTSLQKIHKEKERVFQVKPEKVRKIFNTPLGNEEIENIVKIYAHLINRTDKKLDSPLVYFIGDGKNLVVKTLFLNKILNLDSESGSDAIETLVSNILTYKDRGKKRVGVGQSLITRRSTSEWASSYFDKLLKITENEPVDLVTEFSIGNILVSSERDENGKFILLQGAKKEAEDYLMTESKKPNTSENQEFSKWKSSLAIPEADIKNIATRDMPKDMGRILELFTVYTSLTDEPLIVPPNYTPSILDTNSSNIEQKTLQLLNIISFASSFSNEGMVKINATLPLISKDPDDTPRTYWFELKEQDYQQYSKDLEEGVEMLLESLPLKIKNIIVEALLTLEAEEIESKGNYIMVNYDGDKLNPHEFLKMMLIKVVR